MTERGLTAWASFSELQEVAKEMHRVRARRQQTQIVGSD